MKRPAALKQKAKWTSGNSSSVVDVDGTLASSIPIKDNGILVATLKFALTADRALRVEVISEPGAAGLSAFEAWSNT